MTIKLFEEEDLPIADLEKIGLAKNGRILLDEADLKALVSGRRTNMVRLKNLSDDKLQIPELDAKLSVRPNKDGYLDLLIHPIYKNAQTPHFLTAGEAEELENGKLANIWKLVKDGENKPKDILVEFDPETKEFIVTDTERILIPDLVNNQYLTPEQKERYRKGKEVELSDGTRFQFSATERQSIRSNRLALVASLIIDGGLSYMLYKGLSAAFGKKHDEKSAQFGDGYDQAVMDMQSQENARSYYAGNSRENLRKFTR